MANDSLQKTSSMEEWEEYAELIEEMESAMWELHRKMSGDVPKDVMNRGFSKLENGKTELKSDLENRMAKEHPDEWDTDVFYGQ